MNHAQRPAAELDALHHIAVSTHNLPETLRWYREHFRCQVVYEDDTWAMLQFANVQLALVVPQQHPPHLGFAVPDAGRFGPLKEHRDGTRSTYVADPSGNVVEMIEAESLAPAAADPATTDTVPWPAGRN
jgi:catechol 2,3-dioxygenase-like lactoylglutathione lyase family enzyme